MLASVGAFFFVFLRILGHIVRALGMHDDRAGKCVIRNRLSTNRDRSFAGLLFTLKSLRLHGIVLVLRGLLVGL